MSTRVRPRLSRQRISIADFQKADLAYLEIGQNEYYIQEGDGVFTVYRRDRDGQTARKILGPSELLEVILQKHKEQIAKKTDRPVGMVLSLVR
ncbi:MAG: hypothetical protein NT076_04700 [Candidatus Pacearchaeota archaeon]|nr:hypothetical protein [Candidatus Pacearchaeota archaeon]